MRTRRVQTSLYLFAFDQQTPVRCLSIRARSATDDILLCFVVRSQVSGILLSWSLSHGWHH